jgi:phosphate/sulfate permease|tara:strand:- start:1708 stop:1839 length:132 start_codon:yes stop_codon:yes gene_type:complete
MKRKFTHYILAAWVITMSAAVFLGSIMIIVATFTGHTPNFGIF